MSAIGVAYLTYASTTAKTDTDAVLRDREINLEQTKFDASERERYEQNLLKIILGVLGKTEQERLIGIATLRTLYPDRAEEVLNTIASTTNEPKVKAALEVEAKTAKALAADPWVIIAGADNSFPDAQTELTKAGQAGLTAAVYHRNSTF